jgi:hypothetical protein
LSTKEWPRFHPKTRKLQSCLTITNKIFAFNGSKKSMANFQLAKFRIIWTFQLACVNVMIAILCDFSTFSAKVAFFLKTNVVVLFW